jgi:DNA topoisomerase IB
VIPPAWQDVWICADPRGHIQAVGTDAAGRRQYLYHDLWRQQRDKAKHDRADYTAKDFRTWHATVLAAVGLAVSQRADGSDAARKRAIARVVQEVAAYLGNTPAVARASYIDPRVIDLYQDGRTIAAALGELGKDSHFGDLATRGRAEKAVLDLLRRA